MNDFGLDFNDYFLNNVTATEILLNIIEKKKIKKFIHISSVASIDGKVLKSKNKATTSPDEHYRLTKYLQENLIEKWAVKNEISYAILAPSAIYDTETRLDTNIGKLKKYGHSVKIRSSIGQANCIQVDYNGLKHAVSDSRRGGHSLAY